VEISMPAEFKLETWPARSSSLALSYRKNFSTPTAAWYLTHSGRNLATFRTMVQAQIDFLSRVTGKAVFCGL
jgi:hypothetical protein